ncbi:DsbA family oxidoreductase [Ruania rhizosphaerae]|uniref:DsbA family oxidoreductase n=1 Tax=Ruania rhizosphaerae TaxID=1840413 RepID=UPI0023B27BC4|nr:DsbA family protein [Ruania rhizosphaerae]
MDVWADVRCPWCWIGLRRLQRVKATIEESVRVRRRSLLLEPHGPVSPGRPTAQVARSEWGMSASQWEARSRHIRSAGESEGLRLNVDDAPMFDSNPLHRLLKLADEARSGDVEAVWEDAYATHFERNENLGDPAVLRALASRWALDESEVHRTLTGERFAAEVSGDVNTARLLSVTSVPTVVASNGRRVSGNASVDEIAQFLLAAGPAR